MFANCNLLIVSSVKSFLIDSMLPELEGSGINCMTSEYNVKAIEKIKDMADIVLLFIGDFTADMMKTFVYIKDICADDSKTLYLAGLRMRFLKLRRLSRGIW